MTEPDAPDRARRGLLVAAAASTALLGGGRGDAATPLDLSDPAARLRAYMRMRGALDGRLVIGWICGRYYGVVEEEIRPLYGLVGATFARYASRVDGGYDGVTYEVPFFTDLDTGAVMTRWRNPYTGEEVDVPRSGYPPSAITIGADLSLRVARPMAGMTMNDRVSAPRVVGPDVWMTEETTSQLVLPGAPKPLRYSEVVTLHALRADLERADGARVACQTAFTSVVSWRPWLKMGERAGHLMGVGEGAYGARLDDLPQAWRDGAARYRPEVLKDPAAPLPAFAGR